MPYIVVYPLRAFWNYCCLIINEKFLVTPNLYTQKYLNIRRLNFVNISLVSIIRRSRVYASEIQRSKVRSSETNR